MEIRFPPAIRRPPVRAPRPRPGDGRAPLVRPGRWAQFYPLVPNVSLKRRRGPVMCTSTSFYTAHTVIHAG